MPDPFVANFGIGMGPPGRGVVFVAPGAAMRQGPAKTKKARKWADPAGWCYGPDTGTESDDSGDILARGVQFGIGMGGQLRKFIKAAFGRHPLFGIGRGKPDGRIN